MEGIKGVGTAGGVASENGTPPCSHGPRVFRALFSHSILIFFKAIFNFYRRVGVTVSTSTPLLLICLCACVFLSVFVVVFLR